MTVKRYAKPDATAWASCLRCHCLTRHLNGLGTYDLADHHIRQARDVIGIDQIIEQGIGLGNGGPHLCCDWKSEFVSALSKSTHGA
jgi:hypothetical protein